MKKTELKIRILGDSLLRRRALKIKEITPEHKDILNNMARIMYDSAGIGLAAPQVGISEAMIVVDVGSGLYKFVNPRITKKEGAAVMEEGCLSVPGVCIKVKRARKILLEAKDENNNRILLEAQGLLARVIQHEIDHLYGKLIVDYADFFTKLRIKKQIKGLQALYNHEKLPKSEAKSCKLQL